MGMERGEGKISVWFKNESKKNLVTGYRLWGKKTEGQKLVYWAAGSRICADSEAKYIFNSHWTENWEFPAFLPQPPSPSSSHGPVLPQCCLPAQGPPSHQECQPAKAQPLDQAHQVLCVANAPWEHRSHKAAQSVCGQASSKFIKKQVRTCIHTKSKHEQLSNLLEAMYKLVAKKDWASPTPSPIVVDNTKALGVGEDLRVSKYKDSGKKKGGVS